MSTSCRALTVPAVLIVLSGCVGEAEPEEYGAAAQATLTANTLTANTLTANTLTANTLTANTLTANTLTANGLGALVLSALRDPTAIGATNRMLFRYIVECSLPPELSVSYTWSDVDGTHEV